MNDLDHGGFPRFRSLRPIAKPAIPYRKADHCPKCGQYNGKIIVDERASGGMVHATNPTHCKSCGASMKSETENE